MAILLIPIGPTIFSLASMFQLHPQLQADTFALGSLPLCKVLLLNDSQFPWVILVPQKPDIREIYELSEVDQLALLHESVAISKLLMTHFQGGKLNLATLGNMVPQLHLHHIVRFEDDAAWPKPVWGNVTARPYKSSQRTQLVSDLRDLITGNVAGFEPA